MALRVDERASITLGLDAEAPTGYEQWSRALAATLEVEAANTSLKTVKAVR